MFISNSLSSNRIIAIILEYYILKKKKKKNMVRITLTKICFK